METCVVSDNYFRLVTGLSPAPYPEGQPRTQGDFIYRLLDQPDMYHDGNATSNMLNPPTPRVSTTPVTMATSFCPIEKMPPTLTGAQSNAGITFSGAKSTTQLTKYI